jgi:hypothetical protein
LFNFGINFTQEVEVERTAVEQGLNIDKRRGNVVFLQQRVTCSKRAIPIPLNPFPKEPILIAHGAK